MSKINIPLMIGRKAPDFTLEAFENGKFTTVSLENYKTKVVVLIFYPFDFTFVCPTEIIAFSERAEEFKNLNTEILYISCDSKYSHGAWAKIDPEEGGVKGVKWPMLSDLLRSMCASYGILNDNGAAKRGTVIIDKNGIVKSITINDDKIGRSVDETIRIIENIKFLEENKNTDFCPCNYKVGN